MSRLSALCAAALAAVLAWTPAAADEAKPPKPRVAFIVAGDALADGTGAATQILTSRLTTLGLAPEIASGGGGLRVEVDRPEDMEAIAPVLTSPGVFAIHAAGDIAQTCPDAVPQGMVCMPTIEPRAPFVIVAAEPVLSGDVLEKAVPITGDGVVPQVAINMSAPAAEVFANFTKAMVGQRIAIVVDSRVITAPLIKSPITSGAGVLAGPGIPSTIWAAILTHPPMPGGLDILSVEEVPAK